VDMIVSFVVGFIVCLTICANAIGHQSELKACKDTVCQRVAWIPGHAEECAKFASAVNMPGYTLVCD